MPISIRTIGHYQPGTTYSNLETSALASVITPTPPGSWLGSVDTLISSLKTAGVWQILDLFYCFAAPSPNACSYNWVNPSIGRLTANGTINYSANQYAASDGTTGWFSSGFGVNSGNAVDGNAAFGHFCLSEVTDDISVFQTTGSGSYTALAASSTAITDLTAKLNTSSAASWSSLWSSTVGHFVVQQEDTSAKLEAFFDGTSQGTSVQTHSTDTGTIQLFKSAGGAYTSRRTAFVHYGATLTATQHLVLSKALYSFLAAMDVRPMVAAALPSTGGPANVAPYKHLPTANALYVPISPSFGPGCEFQGNASAYPYAAIKINDPNYNSIVRVEAHAGDRASFDGTNISRVQWNTENAVAVPWQSTCDLSFSFFIESGTVYDTSFTDLCDFHDTFSGVNCGPSTSIDHTTGNFFIWAYVNESTYLNIYGYNNVSLGGTYPCAKGQWHHVRITYRLDNSPNGFCDGWLDGQHIFSYSGGTFGNPSGAPFWWQVALYQGDTSAGPGAVWYANLEFDDTGSQPYAGRISSPLPCPPLTITAPPVSYIPTFELLGF